MIISVKNTKIIDDLTQSLSLLGEKYKYSLAQILEFAEHQDKVKHA